MKNNKNKKSNMLMKKYFNKEEIRFLKKYPSLSNLCISSNIPHCFISRCYKRYKISIKDKDVMDELIKDNYDITCFTCNVTKFCLALNLYFTISEEHDDVKYKKFTYGDVYLKIVEFSGFSKYLNLYK